MPVQDIVKARFQQSLITMPRHNDLYLPCIAMVQGIGLCFQSHLKPCLAGFRLPFATTWKIGAVPDPLDGFD